MKNKKIFLLSLVSLITTGCSLFNSNNLYLKHFSIPFLISKRSSETVEYKNHVDLEPPEYDIGDDLTCEALVINKERDPFIDMVLYLSWVDKHVVFNPQSHTELTDDGWATKIEVSGLPFSYPGNINNTYDQDGYILVDEICFMRSGTTNTKAYLGNANNLKITYHEHRYTNEIVDDKYFFEEDDSTHEARYFKSCNCGRSAKYAYEKCIYDLHYPHGDQFYFTV